MIQTNQAKTDFLPDAIDGIKEVLKDSVEFALLFGSAVTGRMTLESDIDIGAYFKKPIGFDEILGIKAALSDKTDRDIDLIVMNTGDTIITMQILANGKLFINNDPGFFIRYKAGKIGEYIDFKMDRKIIEDNLLRGRIYA